jgi:hypothetical protein
VKFSTGMIFLFPALLALMPARNCESAMSVEIVPRKSLGGISLGESRLGLRERGASFDSSSGDHEFASLDALRVHLIGGKVVDIWIENIRTFPGELTFRHRSVPRSGTWEELQKFFGDCVPEPLRLGGEFVRCTPEGGLNLGRGAGDHVMLRVNYRLDGPLKKE